MDLARYKIKLRGGKDARKGYYQYSLTYRGGENSPAAYDIISALAGDSDIIIEFNTDLFYGVSQEPDKCAEKFLEDIRSLNLEHVSRRVPSQYPVVFLGITIGRMSKVQAYEIAAYVPNNVWKDPSFRDVLPSCGARYYIAGNPTDAGAVLAVLPDLSEERKASMFRLILFHVAAFERFGIISAGDAEKELRGLLGLK